MRPEDDQLSNDTGRLVSVGNIDLRMLSSVYDERDIYLSLYLPFGGKGREGLNESYISKRALAIEKALPRDLRDVFRKTMERVGQITGMAPMKGERGRIILASGEIGFLHVYRLAVEVEQRMVLDTSPFLLPLAELMDDYEDYALVMLDSRRAKLFSIRTDIPQERSVESIDLMNRHKKGGMSQMRFNRLRRGAVEHFLKEVVLDLEERFKGGEWRGIVLAGPGEAKKQLLEMLPRHLSEKVLGTIDISFEAPLGEMLIRADNIAREDEIRKDAERISALREAVMRGEPAAYGIEDIKEALESGRVECLIIQRGTSAPGWICERCQLIRWKGEMPSKCPKCGGPPSAVNVVEELYELAERTGAAVDFVDEDTFMESIGGMGALLRY